MAKLRWLLGKATATLGDARLAELSPRRCSRGDSGFRKGIASKRLRPCARCLNRAVGWS